MWRGQTTIDEVASRASTFTRYALDQAATDSCDWAFLEQTQQALGISGLHAEAAADQGSGG